MASENLKLVQTAMNAANRDGLRAMLDVVHPEIEFEDLPQSLEDRHRSGRPAIEAWIASIEEVWEEPRVEAEEITELDAQTLLVVYRFVARAKGSQIEVEQPLANVCTVTEGMITRWRIFPSKEEALEAAGRADT